MANRGHNEGTIFERKKAGGFQGQVSLPSGKRKSVYGKTKREVQRKMAEVRREIDAGLHGTRDADASVKTYMDMWLAGRSGIREKTLRGYRSIFANHLSSIADISLNDLKPIHLQKLYVEKLRDGLSSTTVHHIHAALGVALKSAVKMGLIPRNPCDFVDAPGMVVKQYPVLQREQVTTLIQGAHSHRLGALFVLAVTTGMREEEFLGLTWDSFDFERLSVKVHQTLHAYAGRRFVLEPTKSRTSRRTLPLATVLVDFLRQYQQQQQEEKEKAGTAYENKWNLVFTTELGTPMRYDNVLRQFHKFLSWLGLPEIRLHDLRHTFATLLIEDGVPIRVISELLGHSSIAITLQIYGHVTPKMHEQAILTIQGWFPSLDSFERM